jgi:hypothetical protein
MPQTSVIEIGGQKREACINQHALMFLGKALNCDPLLAAKEIAKVAEEYPLRALGIVVYAALMGALESKAIFIHDVTLPSVMEWVGEPSQNDYDSIWAMFRDAMDMPKATEEQVKQYEKMLKEQGVNVDEIKKKKKRSPLKNSTNTPVLK